MEEAKDLGMSSVCAVSDENQHHRDGILLRGEKKTRQAAETPTGIYRVLSL
jgi:hypothetical protein